MSGNDPEPDIATASLFLLSAVAASWLAVLLQSRILPGRPSPERLLLPGVLSTAYLESGLLLLIWWRYPGWLRDMMKGVRTFWIGVRSYFVFLPLLAVVVTLNVLVLRLLRIPVSPQEVFNLFLQSSTGLELTALVLLSCVLAPLAEETVFRGLLYRAVRRRLSAPATVGITALVFGLFHADPANLAGLFFLGCLLGVLAERHGSLWPSIGLHVCNNSVATVAVLTLRSAMSGPA